MPGPLDGESGDPGRTANGVAVIRPARSREQFAGSHRNRAALGVACFAFLFNLAMDNLFVVYGVWLEEAFQLSLLAVDVGTSVNRCGGARAGEFLTAGLADRSRLSEPPYAGSRFAS